MSLLRHQSRVWIDYTGDIIIQIFSFLFTAQVLLTSMSEKCTSTSKCAIQVKDQQKTISTEQKLDTIGQHEKSEWIVDICHNGRLTHSSACTIHDNADRIKGSVTCLDCNKCQRSETQSLCSKTITVLSELTVPETVDVSILHFYCIRNKSIHCI